MKTNSLVARLNTVLKYNKRKKRLNWLYQFDATLVEFLMNLHFRLDKQNEQTDLVFGYSSQNCMYFLKEIPHLNPILASFFSEWHNWVMEYENKQIGLQEFFELSEEQHDQLQSVIHDMYYPSSKWLRHILNAGKRKQQFRKFLKSDKYEKVTKI